MRHTKSCMGTRSRTAKKTVNKASRGATPAPGASPKPVRRRAVENVALRAVDKKIRAAGVSEVREVQVNSAVYPSEVQIFNQACRLSSISRSDFIRDKLIQLAEKHGLIKSEVAA